MYTVVFDCIVLDFSLFESLDIYKEMDLFEFLEDDFDFDFIERITCRKRRVIRSRINHFAEYDDDEFRTRFRLTKSAVNCVLSLIENDIKALTNNNSAIPPANKLLPALRYYATGSFLTAAGDLSGVSKASASRIVAQVSAAIAKLRPIFVKIPKKFERTMQEFYEIARFPRVIGVIDCTHINIQSPGGIDAEYYRNRHGNFSMNVQVIVDSNLKINVIVARWPGSCHDQTIFNNSRIKERLNDNEFPNCHILGDRGYENSNFLLTPLHNPISSAEKLYNESQIRTRNVVERSFGVWKSRFPVLSKKIILHISKVQPIIVACAVLHNISILSGDEHFLFEPDSDSEDQDRGVTQNEPSSVIQSSNIRNNIILNYFSTLQ